MTNFEKIKQMSVEEMATAIVILLATHLNRWNVVNGSKEQHLTLLKWKCL